MVKVTIRFYVNSVYYSLVSFQTKDTMMEVITFVEKMRNEISYYQGVDIDQVDYALDGSTIQ